MFRFLALVFLGSALEAGSLAGAVRLTEVMATNPGALLDEDGEGSDWVELHNAEAVAVNLEGWSLADEAGAGWRFPAVTIPAGGYLVVFCSGKDRAVAGRELHTDFELNDGGETLVLRDRQGAVAGQLKFGLQYEGLVFDGVDYLAPATPGMSNATASVAMVRAPEFSEGRGFKRTAFDLSLTCGTPGAEIFYTLDGSEPAAGGLRYVRPIRVSRTTPVRAVAVMAGKRDSAVVTSTFLFVADMVRQSPTGRAPAGWPSTWGANRVDYGMDPRVATSGKFARALPGALQAIPTMAITLPLAELFDEAAGIYANPGEKGREWERAASIELLNAGGGEAGFQVNAGLRIRGGASRSLENPKHSFRVLLRKEYGAEFLDYPLFGAAGPKRTERFDLRCEQLVSWHAFFDPKADFIRDIYGRTLQGKLGQPHTRSGFYHLVINGQYWGLYQTQERVSAEYAAETFGGAEEDYDVVKVNFDDTVLGGGTDFVDGSFGAWRRAVALGGAGLERTETYYAIQGLNVDGTRNAQKEPLIDVDNLIDYMLAGIYIAADDSPPAFGTQNNWGAIRSRKGAFGFQFFAHDWEISMGGQTGDENRVGPAPTANPFVLNGTVIDPTEANPWHFWQAMRMNAEFRLRVADRVQKHFHGEGALVQERATGLWREFMETIDQAVIGESARWGDARLSGGTGGRPRAYTRDDWLKACNENILRGFLADRTRKVLGHLREGGLAAAIQAPGMSPLGGVMEAGTKVVLTAPEVVEAGTGETVEALVFYTTNGSDPRLPGGGISRRAVAYAGPFELGKDGVVLARAYHAGQWSALVEAAFEVSTGLGALRLTEVHYQPPESVGDGGEFLELRNTGATVLNLSGVRLSEGIEYVFPAGSVLAPGGYAVVARDPAVFQARYGFAPYGPYAGRLSNEGEAVTLSSPGGGRISRVRYDDGDGWPTGPAGYGHSLVYDGRGDADEGRNWHASGALGGSPGAGEAVPMEAMPVVIQEVAVEGSGVGIELLNETGDAVAVGDWELISGMTRCRLGGGAVVPAGGRLVLRGSDLGGLVLHERGGTVALQRPAGSGLWRDAVCRFEHGALKPEVSYARWVTSEGRVFFPQRAAASLGLADAGPKASGIRIVEIHYEPEVAAGGGGAQAAPGLEFVEVQNVTEDPIDLSGFRMAGVQFVFPAGSVVPAGGVAVVALVEPDVFRERYGIAGRVPVFGPALETLDVTGERLAMERPVAVEAGLAFEVLEEVRYARGGAWPAWAAGRGHSLQRYGFGGYAAEPGSWGSAEPSPGEVNRVNEPPVVRLQAVGGTGGSRVREYEAVASDRDGVVSRIEFVVNGEVMEERGASPARFAFTLTQGIHDVWVRVTDDQGAVTLSEAITVDAEALPEGVGQGLRAQYFGNEALAGEAAHEETVAAVGGDWFHVDPAPGVSRVGFSVRYDGQLLARRTGTHSLVFLATGGLRVRVGGELAVDQWEDGLTMEPRRWVVPVVLEAGEAVRLEVAYRDTDGLAHLSVQMQEPGAFLEEPILPALLLAPGQDVGAVAVGTPVGIGRRYVGQRVQYPLKLLNAPVGNGQVEWSVVAGEMPEGLRLARDGTLSGRCGTAGQFDFEVRATLPDGRRFERWLEMRVVDRSVAAPKVTIATPRALVVTADGTDVTAGGQVVSRRRIAAVYYTLNGGLRHRLPGAEQWSVVLREGQGLLGGSNELAVQAEDEEGRLSQQVTLSFMRRYPAPLTVAVRGAGTVTRGFLGISTRTVGRQYAITAAPAKGYVFSHWAGDVRSEEPRIQFMMQRGFRLEAHFVETPFADAVGSYAGLLVNETVVGQNTRLRLRLNLARGGEFSGVANHDCTSFSIRGRFSPAGRASVGAVDPRTGRYVGLELVFDAGTGAIQASSEVYLAGTTVVMQATLGRVVATPEAGWVGRWNVLLPPEAGGPPGHGFMVLMVSSRGNVAAAGRLPSGVTFTDAASLTQEGAAPIYARLASNAASPRKESLTGVAQFPAGRNRILRGTMLWAAALDPYGSAGDLFAHAMEAEGSPWRVPGRGVPFLTGEGFEIRMTGGGLVAAIREPLVLTTATAYEVRAVTGEVIRMKVNRELGSVTGSVSLAAGGGKPRRVLNWRGLAHPAMNRVAGFFRDVDGVVGNVEVGIREE